MTNTDGTPIKIERACGHAAR